MAATRVRGDAPAATRAVRREGLGDRERRGGCGGEASASAARERRGGLGVGGDGATAGAAGALAARAHRWRGYGGEILVRAARGWVGIGSIKIRE